MTSPAELQAIRYDDSRWSDGYVAADPSGLVAQRRTMLALYDAHEADKLRLSDEVRRLRAELQRIDTAFENTDYADRDSEEHFEKIRDIARAALGSQP